MLSRKIPQLAKIGKASESFPKRRLLKLETVEHSMDARHIATEKKTAVAVYIVLT